MCSLQFTAKEIHPDATVLSWLKVNRLALMPIPGVACTYRACNLDWYVEWILHVERHRLVRTKINDCRRFIKERRRTAVYSCCVEVTDKRILSFGRPFLRSRHRSRNVTVFPV